MELENAMLRRFRAAFERHLSADELAEHAKLDAAYEAQMNRLAEQGITRADIVGPDDGDGDVLLWA